MRCHVTYNSRFMNKSLFSILIKPKRIVMASILTRSTNKPQGPTIGEVDTLACIYCRASVHFVGLPATRYVEHLCKFNVCIYFIEINHLYCSE